MRKEMIGSGEQAALPGSKWFNLETLATVELSSEDPQFPIESAIANASAENLTDRGWRAGETGRQTIRFKFDQPQQVRRVWIRFYDRDHERAQEFVLRWSADGREYRDVVRQQWTFSPAGSVEEVEEYQVELNGVAAMELVIDPDRGKDETKATLAGFRLG